MVVQEETTAELIRPRISVTHTYGGFLYIANILNSFIMSNMKNEKKTSLQMVEIDHNKIAVELTNGNVNINLTHMAKPFGSKKKPDNWLRMAETQDYLRVISISQKRELADLVKVRNGGVPGTNGTWCTDYRIAMRFAQWLSPEFSVQVDDLLVKLMRGELATLEPIGGVFPLIHNGVVGYPRKELLIASGYSSTSGNVHLLNKKYPNDKFKIYRILCFSPKLAKLIHEKGKVRQLEIEFKQYLLEGGAK